MEGVKNGRTIVPRAVRVSEYMAESWDSSQVLACIFGGLAMGAALLGLSAAVYRVILMIHHRDIVTEYDWLVLGIAIIIWLWKAVTHLMGAVNVGNDSPIVRRSLNVYFGISFFLLVVINSLCIAIPVYVFLTATPDFRDLILAILLIFLGYIAVDLVLDILSLIFILKCINRVHQAQDYVGEDLNVQAQLGGFELQ